MFDAKSAATNPPGEGTGSSGTVPRRGVRTEAEEPPPGDRGEVDFADRMERALLEARELIDSTMSLHRSRSDGSPLVVPTGDADLEASLQRLMGRARHSVTASLPGDDEETLSLLSTLLRRPSHTASSAGAPSGARRVAVRLLCGPAALRAGIPSPAELRAAHCEIRVMENAPEETLIVDGCLALIKAGPDVPEGIAIIRDPASVRALDLLFACSWGGARPLEEHLRLSGSLHSPSARRVLERLREGQTDDVAARELQVSLRTYRRHVAEVMSELGVSSRFQAGVRAVELGLLSRHPGAGHRQARLAHAAEGA
ncbi:hypothetical protein GCM10023347_46310 [Streptomyces chumphonensis]|uniref:Helix-turn-helix transcriptional regulator n=1 Tax=Streptomyces chumphonensis TaxID=1214925 RepID=A0A927IAW8_9ACTN|nr:helix-turn-helix transcriptional regulator [Streptomyces chumphonensis]MBD3932233.1 helix-turn-helix transcriptional regulator [Streptomyces chumphonensis]